MIDVFLSTAIIGVLANNNPWNAVIVEIKARGELSNEDLVQAINTTERLNIKHGLLINFGGPSLQYKHIFNNKVQPETDFSKSHSS